MRSKVIFFITFLVAFCSIVYELIFSQALTVIFGGTVLRYSVTIGLFLFSLGIGSFLFKYIGNTDKNFFRIEVLLSFFGALGVIFILYINSLSYDFLLNDFGQFVLLLLSHVPIIIVGVLCGLEIPFLSYMIEKGAQFSVVLGFDYFGSLAGTLVYGMYLYPFHGLIVSAFWISFLNALVGLLFVIVFMRNARTYLITAIAVFLIFLAVLSQGSYIQEDMTKMYLGAQIQQRYWSYGAPASEVLVTEHFNTPYQEVTKYNLTFAGPRPTKDSCLNLDAHVQMCDAWVKAYHNGLVDVSMAFLNKSGANVLIIGGGDWIPMNYLKKYGAIIDHVDIDNQFVEYAKNDSWIRQYNNDSFNYANLTTYIEDGFYFLKNNKKKYDIIYFDLPGIEHDKLINLASVEIFSFVKRSLSDGGLFVTWTYPQNQNPLFYQVYMNSVKTAGFSYFLPYIAYETYGTTRVDIEDFLIFSNANPKISLINDYVLKYSDIYLNTSWRPVPYFEGVRVNSIFAPNNDIIVTFKKTKMPEY